MKDKITELDKEFARAVAAAEPAYPAPDYDEMMEKSYAMAMQLIAKKEARKSNVMRGVRRGLIAVSAAMLIIVISAIFSVMSPPQSASADSWFDKIVITLKNAFRIETAPTNLQEVPEIDSVTYASIEDARAAGYVGYTPTYIPEGYALESIYVRQSDLMIHAIFSFSNSESSITLTYQQSKNSQQDTITDDAAFTEPFVWMDFVGTITNLDDETLILSCVNMGTDELITIIGHLSPTDAKSLVFGLEKTEAGTHE